MAYQTIRYSSEGTLAQITLNRPKKLNAIDATMVAELNQALDAAEQDDNVRVILLAGAGRAFSAGFDIDMSGDVDHSIDLYELRQELHLDFEIIMRFWNSPKITIAAVHGYCLGSAMEMAVACDITLAAEGCLFGAPEVRFGSGIVALLLPWFIGPKRSKELLLTGDDKVSAKKALDYGLVNRVVAASKLKEEAREMARVIAGNEPLAVRLTKQAINRSFAIAGMREALRQALELNIIIEGTETEESRKFTQILKEQGTRAAIKWRESQMQKKPQQSD